MCVHRGDCVHRLIGLCVRMYVIQVESSSTIAMMIMLTMQFRLWGMIFQVRYMYCVYVPHVLHTCPTCAACMSHILHVLHTCPTCTLCVAAKANCTC